MSNAIVSVFPRKTMELGISDNLTRYHTGALQIIDPEYTQKALKNEPFGDIRHGVELSLEGLEEKGEDNSEAESLAHFFEALLRRKYPMFDQSRLGFKVDYSLNPHRRIVEGLRFQMMIGRNRRLGFQKQARESLTRHYDNFRDERKVLSYMEGAGILNPFTVLPDSQLPWFLLAAPVWFVDGKITPITVNRSVSRARVSNVTISDSFVQYMVERLGTIRLANWYQLWNRQSRKFSDYAGDVMPESILKTIESLRPMFDYLVIATPYHDLASKDWADPKWPRLVDPYLLGFKVNQPSSFFFLGRWSDTGIFPLAAEMTGRTMQYVEEHKQLVSGVSGPHLTEMGKVVDWWWDLPSLVEKALEAFENETLFEWLTEGRTPTTMT